MGRGSSVLILTVLAVLAVQGEAYPNVGQCECNQRERCECHGYVDVNPSGKGKEDRVHGHIDVSIVYAPITPTSDSGNLDVTIHMADRPVSKRFYSPSPPNTNWSAEPVCVENVHGRGQPTPVAVCVFLHKVVHDKKDLQITGKVMYFARTRKGRFTEDIIMADFVMQLHERKG